MSVTNRFTNALKSASIFGVNVPSFNVNGKYKIDTFLGGVLTFLVIVVVALFGSYKMIKLVNQLNPQFSTILMENNFSLTDRLYLNENNFKIAISIVGKYDGKTRHDSRYG